jgi:hypothetical protein
MHRFGQQGEKTGWTYVEIPADLAQKLKPGNKKEFKVKGSIDTYELKRVSLLPMGGGVFILPVNAVMRKAIGKKEGAMVRLQLEADNSAFVFNKHFIACLKDEPAAKIFFEGLTGSHQRYFSKWIDSAKSEETRVKRITMAVNALAKNWGYQEMMRDAKKNTI